MQLPQYPRYGSYKDSGEGWIGEIPEHWDDRKLKHLFREKKHRPNMALNSGAISFGEVVEKDDDRIPLSTKASYQEVLAGEFLVNPLNLNYDLKSLRIGLSDIDVVVSAGYIVLQASSEMDKRYFKYLLHRYDVANMKLLGSGVRQTISFNHIANSILVAPPIEEQQAIARFLDDKTDKIDRAVKIKEGQIALLRERKQIIIQEAVTKGLNPAAPMKDSGIDWIGQIPAHWDVENPKWLFRHRKEKARKGEQQLAATQKYGVIPQQEYMELEGRRIVQVFLDFDILKHVEAGDFVMSMRSFQGGIEYSDYTGCVSSAYVAMEPGELIHAPYFKYLLKSPRFIEALQVTSNLVRDGQALRFDNFSMVTLPVVPLEEQRQIAIYIDDALSKSDKAIELKQRQIEALKEYKATLINAAVTGKIKVI